MDAGSIMRKNDKQKLVTLEDAAKLCGWKMPVFMAMLAKPLDAPGRPKYLHIIDGNFLDLVEVKRYIKRSRERQLQAPIVDDETLKFKLEAITKLFNGTKDAALVAFSNFAGLRIGEIAALKVLDVMNDDGSLKKQTFLYRDLTKTRQSRAIFLVDPVLIKYLKPYIKQRTMEHITSNSRLFVSTRGNDYNGNRLAQYIKRVYRSVGLPDLSSHSGRAATAKRFLSQGKTLKFVGTVLGHTSTATTAKYDRVRDDEVLAYMEEQGND